MHEEAAQHSRIIDLIMRPRAKDVTDELRLLALESGDGERAAQAAALVSNLEALDFLVFEARAVTFDAAFQKAAAFGTMAALAHLYLKRPNDASVPLDAALVRGVANCHPDTVSFLLSRGADPLCWNGESLCAAAELLPHGVSSLVTCMLLRHAAPQQQHAAAPLHRALLHARACGNDTVVALLLDCGAPLELDDFFDAAPSQEICPQYRFRLALSDGRFVTSNREFSRKRQRKSIVSSPSPKKPR